MERILYIWAIRHPASGYVQGINDLLTPLYVVFLSAHVGEPPSPFYFVGSSPVPKSPAKVPFASKEDAESTA